MDSNTCEAGSLHETRFGGHQGLKPSFQSASRRSLLVSHVDLLQHWGYRPRLVVYPGRTIHHFPLVR